jgi:alkylation response protein AidB-like acyl-CoA dehydrogenase
VRFSFSAEQQILAESAEQWGRQQSGHGLTRAAVAGKAVPVGDLWAEMSELGWLGVTIPDEAGGSGGSLVDACIVAEALARHLVPVPYVGNAVIAAAGLRALGSDQGPLADLAAGTRRFSVVLGEDLGWPPTSDSGLAWEWTEGDALLVVDDGALSPRPDLEVCPLPTVDLLRRTARVEQLPRRPIPGGAAVDRFLATARVGLSALLLGMMDGALRRTVEYAQNRRQFGRAIGSFQAVQHLCAEMLVDTEAARSAVYGAAWAVEHAPPARAATAAATAKAWCASAAVRVCEAAMQVHGGIGMTWECDMHLYLRASHLVGAAFCPGHADLDLVADARFGHREGLR